MGSRLDANSSAVRKRIEKHKFENEEGEEYEGSKFGGFTDYFRRKKIKLQNLDAELRCSGSNPPIFRGVVAHVNGYTQPSLNDLHGLIVSYGGGFMQYLDGKTTVTHIIASILTPKKKVEFSRYRIVKPAWVVDSIQAGRLLPWDAYRVVDEGVGQRVLGFDNGNVISQANSLYRGYKDQTDTSWYTEQVKGVADELNLRDPDPRYRGTQVPVDNEIEDGQEEYDWSKSVGSKENAMPYCSLTPGHTTSNVHPQSDLRLEECSNPTDGPRLGAHTEVDSQIIPAVNESQDGIAQQLASQPSNDETQHDPPAVSPRLSLSMPTCATELQRDKTTYPNYLFEQGTFERSTEETPGDFSGSPLSPASPGYGTETDSLNSHDNISAQGKINMSAEEHNALLLSDPRVWKSTVVNPGFLKQYYEESRLHHLSTWKADLKSQLQALAAGKSSSQTKREERVPGSRRFILHVDFDSFFAAVSLKKNPEYVDKPVVVAHGGGSGSEIASCNYPARKFGVKNGMWMKHAQKMCPELKVLPYDFKGYEEASRKFYDAIMETGGIVQSVSVDEALVDISATCTAGKEGPVQLLKQSLNSSAAGGHEGEGIHEGSIWREQVKADEIATNLREEIKKRTGCAVSVGIGGNILLAKVALRKAKPAGQHHIKPEEALDFLGDLTMQELPGIAYSIGGKLEEIGVKYVKDVRALSKERMISTLGPKTGEKIWDYSRGIDRTEVGEQVIRKSVSAEVNWGIRFVTQEQADEFVQCLCEELHKRLVNEKLKGRQLLMKIMRRAADAPLDPPKHLGHGKCDTFNKSVVLGVPTNDKEILGREAISIMRGWGFSPGELRGIGVQMTKLEPLKGIAGNPPVSSQKRLQFKTFTPSKPRLPRDDTVEDDIESPKTQGWHPAAAFVKDASPGGRPCMPLNIMGTQFVMPTQVDPEVIAELPSDIRSKLLSSKSSVAIKQINEHTPAARSRSQTPSLPQEALPSHSQIDPETLSALPPDVRAEILSFYNQTPHKSYNQAILPQSPRKARSIKHPKKFTTPTKKRTGLLSHNNKQNTSLSTLTQSNFVANARASTFKAADGKTDDGADEISEEFLSALPPDIRAEVLAQARRERLQKRGGIDVSTSMRKRQTKPQGNNPRGQRTLTLPPRPPKPSFTAQKFTQLPELRKAVSAWYAEFRAEGPYEEDVDALAKYLGRVVEEEGDMDKAVRVGRWLGWVVDEGYGGEDPSGESKGRELWRKAVHRVKEGMQAAVRERGLGNVDF